MKFAVALVTYASAAGLLRANNSVRGPPSGVRGCIRMVYEDGWPAEVPYERDEVEREIYEKNLKPMRHICANYNVSDSAQWLLCSRFEDCTSPIKWMSVCGHCYAVVSLCCTYVILHLAIVARLCM